MEMYPLPVYMICLGNRIRLNSSELRLSKVLAHVGSTPTMTMHTNGIKKLGVEVVHLRLGDHVEKNAIDDEGSEPLIP